MISGPADTGKSLGCLQFLDALAWKYPGCRLVILRKVYKDMPGSVLETYERDILGLSPGQTKAADGIVKFGGERPEFYQYPNGTRIRVAGLDNPGKVLSSERDCVYVNQAEEISLADWETITTRTSGRAGGMPFAMALGDCNPGSHLHWIKQRANEGSIVFLESRHQDNPELYDEAGNITPEGKRRIGALDRLTGVRKARLRYGIWAAAEGIVFEDSWDADTNLVDRMPFEPRRRLCGVDWGFTNPGVLQVWGLDGDKRMAREREIYRAKRTIDWWILQAKALRDYYRTTPAPIEVFVCDPSEPGFIQQFRDAGLRCVEAYNDIKVGLQNVAARMKPAEDKIPRLVLVKGSSGMYDGRLAVWIPGVDKEVKKEYRPISTEEEIECYVYPMGQSGKPVKEIPVDDNNHGNDAMRYTAAYVDGLGVERKPTGVLTQSSARIKLPR